MAKRTCLTKLNCEFVLPVGMTIWPLVGPIDIDMGACLLSDVPRHYTLNREYRTRMIYVYYDEDATLLHSALLLVQFSTPIWFHSPQSFTPMYYHGFAFHGQHIKSQLQE